MIKRVSAKKRKELKNRKEDKNKLDNLINTLIKKGNITKEDLKK